MKKGFTLIELLVVVLIIGILSAVALPKYQVAVERARVTQAIVTLKAVTDALNRYYMANGSLPPTSGMAVSLSEIIDELDIEIDIENTNFTYKALWTSSISTPSSAYVVAQNVDKGYLLGKYVDGKKGYCYSNEPEGSVGVRICKMLCGSALNESSENCSF
ncbi:MAG: prepilin-type N-terminal cleavage/methylation domain-containing protein [Elusimicrobiaceae bacterium]|nr:prepilin-type N-terminal cleavage/methylation domain-containing protein [Elusimicrobiaceae bacterium]